MSKVRSVLTLDFDYGGGSDVSRGARPVKKRGIVKVDRDSGNIKLEGSGYLEVAQAEALRDLDSFTVEVAFAPAHIGSRQQVLEGESLPVSISIEPDGKLVGAVHTDQGWVTVDSGEHRIQADEDTAVRLVCEGGKALKLEINDIHANTTAISGSIQRTGEGGLVIGRKANRKSDSFRGSVDRVRVRDGAIDAMGLDARAKKASELGPSEALLGCQEQSRRRA